jgi:hypothetical protein
VTPRLSFRDGIQFAWDSTSLNTFKECPRKYYYSIVQGWSSREQSVHLTFGIYMHEGLELYHRLRTTLDHERALRQIVGDMMVRTKNFKSDDKYKNRFNLIRALVWYLDAKKDDPAKTIILSNGKPAVELSFRFELPNAPDFLYCGHMDRIASFDNHLYVFDTKTTKRALYTEFFDQFNPHNQMTGYTLGGKITFSQPVKGVVIDAVQLGVGDAAKPDVGFARFARGFSLRAEEQLDEWLHTTAYFVKLAAKYAQEDFWPMNEGACNNYFGCQFRPICSKAPKQREVWLKADYVHRLWDPLQVRGDI